MDDPILTIEERAAINNGRWFSALSPSLRHDILRCAFAKRYAVRPPADRHLGQDPSARHVDQTGSVGPNTGQ